MNSNITWFIWLAACLCSMGCEGCLDEDRRSRPVKDGNSARDVAEPFEATGDKETIHDTGPTDVEVFDSDGERQEDVSYRDDSDQSDSDAADSSDTQLADANDTVSRETDETSQHTACVNGDGRAIIRFDYESRGRRSANIALWDVSCSYSADRACDVVEVGEPGYNSNSNAVVLSGNDAVRARFDVTGLAFDKAWVHIQARSYATSSTADFEVWSPLYGAKTGGPVDQDFTYEWHTVDWTGYLSPSDDPDLTAIEISAASGQLALRAVAICIA